MNLEYKRKMPTASEIKELYPLTCEMVKRKRENDERIKSIITGESDKLLLIIGPCSADREDAVLDYLFRLRRIQEKVEERILIVPRIYTNKPRTTGEGYKGMLHQPDPNGSPDLLKGIISIRKLHVDVLMQTGFSSADEMLYPENYQYLSDCLSYVAIGARSVENQLHRLTASGLDVPVGMKNPTSGDLSVMFNSVTAAQHGHTFAFAGWEVRSRGNALTHSILRGYSNRHGGLVPNYHYEDLKYLCELYEKSSLANPAVIVDVNHANSGKHWEEQPRIAMQVIDSMKHSAQIKRLVKGVMVESYIEDGCQKPDGTVYGQSITDACIGIEKTERMIYNDT